jgi:hypothetical protein
MEKLVIDRSKWRTGASGNSNTGVGSTSLLNDQGYMCCLGFFCLSAGLKENDVRGAGTPRDAIFDHNINLMPIAESNSDDDDGIYIDTHFCDGAVNINDSETIDSKTREIEIKNHFATVGIEVEFIGEYKYENILA